MARDSISRLGAWRAYCVDLVENRSDFLSYHFVFLSHVMAFYGAKYCCGDPTSSFNFSDRRSPFLFYFVVN